VDYAHGAAGGDQRAFAELIRRYQQELFAFLARFVSDSAAADDLFQETFIQVHRNAKSFDPERKFRPWLFHNRGPIRPAIISARRRRAAQSWITWQGRAKAVMAMRRRSSNLMDSGLAPPPRELAQAEDAAAVQRVLRSCRCITGRCW